MIIALVRIDDRLIHGQVATSWSKEAKCDRIIVVSDEVAKDTFRKTLLLSVTPPGIKASVVPIDKMIRAYNNPKYEKSRALLLFTNPSDVLRVVDGGVKIESVNIGQMSFKEGRTAIAHAVSVVDEDIEAFNKLNEKGIELELRHTASDPKVNLMDKIKAFSKE
ncbi:PTS fructose transporter subunit IIB [Terrilactibacillus sp. BCM23-1]|uniref:PTS fructose transporter subunit IIB n=1 Tax=Terrilactibacillus tamarindi TaxID=2599694 RepID=A0A6N8CS89_9BACI|nr:mannose/fructose/sorbose PTS transporter subunit IIB [Terrilactibacillus tamarindi]MTT32550.1 PTS fructose transporter subunit IIB [Terrilactibacillus tamarindi]